MDLLLGLYCCLWFCSDLLRLLYSFDFIRGLMSLFWFLMFVLTLLCWILLLFLIVDCFWDFFVRLYLLFSNLFDWLFWGRVTLRADLCCWLRGCLFYLIHVFGFAVIWMFCVVALYWDWLFDVCLSDWSVSGFIYFVVCLEFDLMFVYNYLAVVYLCLW